LLFFYDRTLPDSKNIPMELMKKSLETDLRHGHFSPAPHLGHLYGNFDHWAAKIREAF
jgi:hypothetical protein